MKALVIGGGIGGLAAAIALRKAGIEVEVYERAGALGEEGAAITLWTNAMLAARVLGVEGTIRSAGGEVREGVLQTPDGSILLRTPVAQVGSRLSAPSICLPRSALIRVLTDALAPGILHWGSRCTGFREEAAGITALFDGGTRASGDFLVGADGISSAVRTQLLGASVPRYAGRVCVRAMVRFEVPDLPPGHAFETWGSPDSFGLIPMARGLVYWFANLESEDQVRPLNLREALLERFGAWHAPVPQLIRATEERSILCHPVYDRPPSRRWGTGRATLLGDAAHPATPDLGQGGCLALEDAVVLGNCLRRNRDAVGALRQYETLRIPRTNWMTGKSRWFGFVGHQRSRLLGALRNACVRATPSFLMTRDYVRLVDYDAAGIG